MICPVWLALEGSMRRTEQLQGLRMLKLRDALSRWEAAELSQAEAAELLGMSERTLRRWARRFGRKLDHFGLFSGVTHRTTQILPANVAGFSHCLSVPPNH